MSLIDNFHLLRPLWLLAFIPLAYVVWHIWQRQRQNSGWQQLIPAHLLEHLLEGEQQSQQRWPAILAAIAGTITIFALTGPTWRQIETPVEKSLAPVVLVTNLSSSMLATDVTPNRLTRVKQKMTDILRQRKDGVTAIVAYAGSSHVVAPLTDDSNTLTNLVQALDPSIMPAPGNGPELGVTKAIELLDNGANQGGTILLMTDSLTPQQSETIAKQIEGRGHILSILGVGSENGAPIPGTDGALLRDQNGGIVLAQLERGILQQTARSTGGKYHDMTLNDADIRTLIPKTSITDTTIRVDRRYDSWYDEGRWLTLLILPLVLVSFRRGLVLPLLVVALLTGQSGETLATEAPAQPPATTGFWQQLWNDAWQTPDQQAQQQLNAGNSAAAAGLYTDPDWRTEALDRSGQSAEAAKLFGEQAATAETSAEKADNFYNQANALARAGDLKSSLNAYDKALKQNPDLDAAKSNRKIVEDLLKQQQQQNQQDQKNQQEQDQQEKGDQSQQQNQQNDQKSDNSSPQEGDGQDSPEQKDDQSKDNDQQQNSEQNQTEQQKDDNPEQSSADQTQQEPSEQQENSNDQSSDRDQTGEEEQDATAIEGESDNQDAEQTEAWLRRIPNNPGDLLRRKFEQQQRKNAVTAPRDYQL